MLKQRGLGLEYVVHVYACTGCTIVPAPSMHSQHRYTLQCTLSGNIKLKLIKITSSESIKIILYKLQRCLRLFRENRWHGKDERTDRHTECRSAKLNAAPTEGGLHNKLIRALGRRRLLRRPAQ